MIIFDFYLLKNGILWVLCYGIITNTFWEENNEKNSWWNPYISSTIWNFYR